MFNKDLARYNARDLATPTAAMLKEISKKCDTQIFTSGHPLNDKSTLLESGSKDSVWKQFTADFPTTDGKKREAVRDKLKDIALNNIFSSGKNYPDFDSWVAENLEYFRNTEALAKFTKRVDLLI